MTNELIKLIFVLISTIVSIGISAFSVYVAFSKKIAIIETKISNLDKKVDKHNNVIERTYKLEQQVKDLSNEKR